ncbi:MAG TPA: hypothetical protein VFE50_18830 [Cyclobacteriaceae bacterium]|nr:hypothetical protein [Cyclobacteriaceae bacterium]
MIYLFSKTVYNCKQATLLSIKKEEGKISFVESLKLRYHLMFCDPCRQFIAQWNKITPTGVPTFKLSEEAKERIQKKLL